MPTSTHLEGNGSKSHMQIEDAGKQSPPLRLVALSVISWSISASDLRKNDGSAFYPNHVCFNRPDYYFLVCFHRTLPGKLITTHANSSTAGLC